MIRDVLFKNRNVGLMYDSKYSYLLASTPLNPKGQPKNLKRLVRIKRNAIRALEALDKELRRHRV